LSAALSVEITLTNRPEERPRLLEGLEGFAREHRLSGAVRQAIDLALEEHFTNILKYAYDDQALHTIRVRLELDDRAVLIQIEDDGRPFNLLARPAVNTAVPLESKPIGGLGIHLIVHSMDHVQYERRGEKNFLSLRKQLTEPPASG